MHWPHTFAVYLIYSYLRGSIRTTDCVLFQNDFKLHLLSKQPILEKTWKDQGKTCSAGRSCGKKSRGECFDQRPGGRYHDFGGVSQWIIPENSRRLAPVSERHSALTFYGMRVYIYYIWLVVSNMKCIFHFIYGLSSFPLTFIFFKMVKTTNEILFYTLTALYPLLKSVVSGFMQW